MVKYLVIVESPNKVAKISKYLNENPKDKNTYLVKATGGHIMNLDPKKLSIQIDNNFEPEYVLQEDTYHKKAIAEIKKAYKECQEVIIASDFDLEGENIGYSVCELLDIPVTETKRLIFNEITKKAIQEALENLTTLQPNLINAQKSRRVLDRLIGYRISPVTRSIKNGLSVGRVQSISLKLVVSREKEIEKFLSTNHFKIEGIFQTIETNPITENIYTTLNQTIPDINATKIFFNDCHQSQFTIENLKKKVEVRNPSPPFITATLQQECCRKFNLTAKQVMDVAQKLYEQGLISYPRTDSPKLPLEKIQEIKEYILKTYGAEYHQERQFEAKSKNAQEAHSCIYPTNVETTMLGGDYDLENKIYRIIHHRAVASQMTPSKIRATTIQVGISKREVEKFIGRAEELVFDGFRKIYNYNDHQATKDDKDTDEEEAKMKHNNFKFLEEGNKLLYQSIVGRENYTKPKARYDYSSLVKDMEKLGVGRPSTYPTILDHIQTRGYIVKETRKGEKKDMMTLTMITTDHSDGAVVSNTPTIKTTKKAQVCGAVKNKFFPTDVGRALDEFISQHFQHVFNYEFTSKMEDELKKIESGEAVWHEIVRVYYDSFQPIVEEMNKNLPKFVAPAKSLIDKRHVGTLPDGREAYAYISKFGPVIQILTSEEVAKVGEKVKGKFLKLENKKSIQTVTIEEVIQMMALPKVIGQLAGKDMIVKKGQYGIYLSYDGKNFKCPNILLETSEASDASDILSEEQKTIEEDEVGQLDVEKTKAYLQEQMQTKTEKIIKEIPIKTASKKKGADTSIKVMNGKYGAFFIMNKTIVGIPKHVKPEDLTVEICQALLKTKKGASRHGGVSSPP